MTRMGVSAALAIAVIGCGSPDSVVPTMSGPLSSGTEIDLAPTGPVPPPEARGLGALVTTPTGYLVVWLDDREAFGLETPPPAARTYFARIALDGSVLDPLGVPLPTAQSGFSTQPGVAGACEPGGTCMLLGYDGPGHAIVGVRIAGDQVLDTTPRVLFDAGTFISSVSIAWTGSAYRVTWQEVIADTVSTASVAIDGAFGTPALVATSANRVSLACQGPGCLITYHAGDTFDAPLRGRMVDRAGVLGPELALYQQPGSRLDASEPYWDGQVYWLGVTKNPLGDPTPSSASLYAVRVAPDGSILDPQGILLYVGELASAVHVGHDGTTAEMIWAATSNNRESSSRIARITGDGTVLDPGGALFVTSEPNLLVASTPVGFVACHPGACFEAWGRRVYFDSFIRGTRFRGTTALDPASIEIARSPAGTTQAAVTYAFGHYVAVWRDSRASSIDFRVAAIRGAVFGTALMPLSTIELGPAPQPEPVCPEQDQPVIAASASSYLVVWHEACPYYDNLYGQALDSNGQAAGPAIVVDNSSGRDTHPSVASDGNTFLVVWDTVAPAQVWGRRFTATGAPLGAAFLMTSGAFNPVVAFDGANYLVVWRRNNSNSQRDLYGFHVSPTGALLGSEITVSQVPADDKGGQSIACAGGVCLVSWRSVQVRATRIAPDGTNLDPGGILVGTVTGSGSTTSVAWDGAAFVVTWRTGNQLRNQRIATTGALLTTTNATITPATVPDRPALASNGAGHLVMLYDRFDSTPAFRMRRVRAVAVDDDDPPPVDAGVVEAPPM